jgi:flavin-dependent dehydrogenase
MVETQLDTNWDVIVVGAGPTGSACGAFMARDGYRVLVLDTQHFPRFQVGESLLPICLPVLDELGIEARPDTFVFKRGATFVSEALNKHRTFDFENALPGPPRHAWQVRRDKFDSQVAERAASAGAIVRHGVKVSKVELTADAVLLDCESATAGDPVMVPKQLKTRYLLDASGQGRLLARQFDSIVPYEGFGRSAAVMHFEGIPDAFGNDIGPGNEIQVMIRDESWGWVIPLPNRVLSVGLVTRKRGIAEAIEEHVANSKLLQRWTAGARRTEPRPIRNFSYTNTRSYGSRFACVGDAACFLDPVFSSGVALGLVSARQVTKNLLRAFAEGREADPTLMAQHFEDLQPGYQAFAGIIDRFYHTNFVRHFFFGDAKDPRFEQEITSILAGDVWRSDNNFQQMLAKAHRRGSDPHGSAKHRFSQAEA